MPASAPQRARILFGCLLALSLCAGPLAAQGIAKPPKALLPQTPVGQKLAQWIALFNRGDYDGLYAFHAATDSPEIALRRALTDYRTYLMTRGIDLYRIERATDQEMRLLARERLSGLWISLGVQFQSMPLFSITGVGRLPADPPADLAPKGKLSPDEIVRELDALLKRMFEANAFSGAVLLAKEGKPIFKRAVGLASRAYHAPNHVDTKFNLASMGKMFTGVAVAQLAQAGKLSFADTVGKYLPDYPNKEVAQKVTIHQLLTHTAGLGSDVFNEKFREASKDRFRKVDDLLPLFADASLEFEPGTKWAYSNAGFVVLGAIIERVSGQSYFDYLKQHVFLPAGMQNTDAYEMDRDTPNLAIGYTMAYARNRAELEAPQNNLFLHVVKGTPAGGCFSTVEDLYRFTLALQQHKLLDAEYTSLVLTGKAATGRGEDKYAYGFQDEMWRGKRFIGHRGGFQGISTVLAMAPDSGYTLIVLSNYDTVAQTIAFVVQNLITQE